jgi:hypothetical protein
MLHRLPPKQSDQLRAARGQVASLRFTLDLIAGGQAEDSDLWLVDRINHAAAMAESVAAELRELHRARMNAYRAQVDPSFRNHPPAKKQPAREMGTPSESRVDKIMRLTKRIAQAKAAA